MTNRFTSSSYRPSIRERVRVSWAVLILTLCGLFFAACLVKLALIVL